MDDPTNWNTDAFNEGLGTFKDADMAREVAKRCNAYPGLIACLRSIAKPTLGGKQQQYMAQLALNHLGESR